MNSSFAKRIAKALLPPVLADFAAKRLYRVPVVPSEGFREVECLGLKWRLDMRSIISRSIVSSGIWEPDTTKVVMDLTKPGMQTLAVGANFGYYALIMARIVGSSGHVWAFEPTKKYREQLEWHIAANGLENVITVVPYGLSDKEFTADIALTPQSASMHYGPHIPRDGTEQIQLRRLDDVAGELGIGPIGFISMDIDGHEAAFLRGGKEKLARDRPPIALEFAQRCLHFAGSDVREVAKLLSDLGYEIQSERTREPYAREIDFLIECGNFNRDSNAIAFPASKASPRTATS